MKANPLLYVLCISAFLTAGCEDNHDKAKNDYQQDPSQAAETSQSQALIPDFVGFALGTESPLLAICARGSDFEFASDGQSVCRWPTSGAPTSIPTDALPDGSYMVEMPLHRIPNGVKSTALMTVIGNRVHSIMLTTSLSRQSKLLDLMKERYSTPTDFEDTTFTTSTGERWPTFEGVWRYSNGYIRFIGIDSNMGTGTVWASTNEAAEWSERGNGNNSDSF